MKRLVPIALALAACNTGFEPQYRVADLRVLAVGARLATSLGPPYQADVHPGDPLTLEALVANPRAYPTVQVHWFYCEPSLDTRVLPCDDPEFQRDPVGLAADSRFAGRLTYVGQVDLTAGATSMTAAIATTAPQAAAALDAMVALATARPTFLCQLFVNVPVVAVAEGGGRREVAVKHVRLLPPPVLTGAYQPNWTPVIDGVESDPTDEDSCLGGSSVFTDPLPGGKTTLCGRAVSAESVARCDEHGPTPSTVEEDLSWQWYVTAGTFPDAGGVGNAMGGSIDFERPTGAFVLWGILRDGRGGAAWTAVDVASMP